MSVNHDLPTINHSHVLTVQQYTVLLVYTCIQHVQTTVNWKTLRNFAWVWCNNCDKMLGKYGCFKFNGFSLTIWHSFTSFPLSEFPNLQYKFPWITYRRPWASWIALIWSSTVILAWAAFCVAAMLHKHKQCI